MNKTIVHHERATSLEVTVKKVEVSNSVIKLGLDIHFQVYVAVAQYDHTLPKAPRRMEPKEFVPWVESLLRAGHTVHVVYEACGFGFGLYRQLRAALVECAWRMVRFQPQYPPVKKRLSVLAKGSWATGAQRKKAIVAVARQLAVDLWRLHTGRCTADQLGFRL